MRLFSAHRLSTIIDYDRVIVLSYGKLAEFDTPLNLLNKDDSIFKVGVHLCALRLYVLNHFFFDSQSMCEQTGHYQDLYEAAKAANTLHV